MSSLNSVLTRQALASGVTLQVGTDTPVAIRLRKLSVGSVTSVTVTTATNIVMITSDGGTDTYTFATYTTVGALVDAINADGIFEAKVLDALRSQGTTSSQFVTGAITSSVANNNVTIWDVLNDTSVTIELGVCLSAHREFDFPAGHRVHLQQVVYSVNMGTAAADSFQIYKRKGTVETKIFGQLSVDTTETTLTFASGEGKISAGPGEELFVRVKDAATLADAGGNFVRLVGIIE